MTNIYSNVYVGCRLAQLQKTLI